MLCIEIHRQFFPNSKGVAIPKIPRKNVNPESVWNLKLPVLHVKLSFIKTSNFFYTCTCIHEKLIYGIQIF